MEFHHQSNAIKLLLTQLQKLPTLQSTNIHLSDSDFTLGMKLIAEGKTSSMSRRHYGMYKALLSFPFTITTMVTLINTAVQNTFMLRRWKKIVQVMLCKKPGNFNLDKLRVIQLLEADINMYFRLIWGKRLIHSTLRQGLFNPEQLGNRPGTMGASGPLLKVLTFDLIRLLKASATIFQQ